MFVYGLEKVEIVTLGRVIKHKHKNGSLMNGSTIFQPISGVYFAKKVGLFEYKLLTTNVKIQGVALMTDVGSYFVHKHIPAKFNTEFRYKKFITVKQMRQFEERNANFVDRDLERVNNNNSDNT